MGEYTVTGSGLDCKSSAYGSEGSSPSSPTITYHFKKFSNRCRYGKPVAIVNGSNSANKSTIEVSHGESVPIRCSAALI